MPRIAIPLRDFMHRHRRAMFGMGILVAVAGLLFSSSAEFQGFYSDLFRLQAKNTIVFYLLFAGLLTIAFLTSIFPASIFGVLAGALFGLFTGFIISALSALVAALVAFIFSRYFFRAASRAVVAKVIDLERTEARLTKHGWRYALLIRSAPIAPFGITSYALGLTTIGLGEYLLTTLAAFPFLLTCVFLGSSGAVIVQGGQIDGDSIRQLAVLFTGASLTFWLVTRLLPKLWLRLFMR